MFKVVSTGLVVRSVFAQQLNNVASQIPVPNMLMSTSFWDGFYRQIDIIDSALDSVMKNDAPNSVGPFGKQYLEEVDLREVGHFLNKIDE